MKTLLFTLSLALIAFGGLSFISSNPAYACSSCGCAEMKKECNCASKKSGKKPCTMCDKSEKEWNAKKNKDSMKDHSDKGSLTIMSRGKVNTGFNE